MSRRSPRSPHADRSPFVETVELARSLASDDDRGRERLMQMLVAVAALSGLTLAELVERLAATLPPPDSAAMLVDHVRRALR